METNIGPIFLDSATATANDIERDYSDRSVRVIIVDPSSPEEPAIERAAEILRRGGLVAFPTETVYGLGANALDVPAVEGIYAAKGRPSFNPLIVHVPEDRKSTRLNSSHVETSYAVFCL